MSARTKNGRPAVKGPVRNFRFRKTLDEFLTKEAGEGDNRTGKTMTLYLEQSLAHFQGLKPTERDAILNKAINGK